MKGYISTLLLLTLASLSYAQSINVKGVIQDSDLMPIPGANVIVKNTNTGAISDLMVILLLITYQQEPRYYVAILVSLHKK